MKKKKPSHFLHEALELYGRKKFSVEEYFEIDNGTGERYEYLDGEIWQMAGAGRNHSEIAINLIHPVLNWLKGRPCRPYMSDFVLSVEKMNCFFHPDLTIVCDPVDDTIEEEEVYNNPCVIIEILSPSTRSYDLGRKFKCYQQIAGLREYILVDSEKIYVLVHRLNAEKGWESEVYTSPDEMLVISNIHLSIPLRDIYQRVKVPKRNLSIRKNDEAP